MWLRSVWAVVKTALRCYAIKKAFPSLSRAGWTCKVLVWFTFLHGFIWIKCDDTLLLFRTVGVFVFSPTSTNVTVMFPSGAGIEVRLREGTVAATVLLPDAFKDATLGLLGTMNSDATDDLVLSNGQPVQNPSDPEDLFSFGASCKETTQICVYFFPQLHLQYLL